MDDYNRFNAEISDKTRFYISYLHILSSYTQQSSVKSKEIWIFTDGIMAVAI